jgi:hypothetical protein
MQKVLSNDLWKSVRAQARQSRQRKAAIAYVTRDLVGFRKDDVLVLDASPHAIASGETNARLLRTLCRRRVRLYHCADLHAKVLLLDDVAVVSSGNMSRSSDNALVEAAVLTDHSSTVSGVASFIEQLVHQSEELQPRHIDRLCRIKVIRRGGRGGGPGHQRRKTRLARLGNRTWLVGVRELVRDPVPAEQKMIAKAEAVLRSRFNDLEWIRWSGKGRFIRECRAGDSLIQIWRSSRARRPSSVIRAQPVLLKQKTKNWTRFYLPPGRGAHAEIPWGKFQRLLKSLGYARRVGPGIEHLLEGDIADALNRQWNSVSRKSK